MTALLMALILCVGMVSGTNKEVRAQSASQNSETQTALIRLRTEEYSKYSRKYNKKCSNCHTLRIHDRRSKRNHPGYF